MAFGKETPTTPGSVQRVDLKGSQLEQQLQQVQPPPQPTSMQNTTLEKISRLFAPPTRP
jgi:hypothetical protein